MSHFSEAELSHFHLPNFIQKFHSTCLLHDLRQQDGRGEEDPGGGCDD